jgi:ABC-type transport system involved in multi-copper enzyme maturation permease subunit
MTASGFVAGTSAWGLLMTLPIDAMVLMLFLPFITADGVTRDLSRRTHEFLMTTTLSKWAYVWGRYLIGLLISLGLTLLLMATLLGMGEFSHLTVADYPAPDIGTVLLLWGGLVMPATVLVSSLSFALGTLIPRHATQVKVCIMVAWIVGAVFLPDLVNSPAAHTRLPTWYVNWDPTGRATAIGTFTYYDATYDRFSKMATNSAQLQHLILSVENKVPDISAWLVPHLIIAGLSLMLVVLAAFAFRRFRTA